MTDPSTYAPLTTPAAEGRRAATHWLRPLSIARGWCARFSLAPLSLVLLLSAPAAAETHLAAEPMAGKKVRLDGMLKEWPSGFPKLKVALKGKASGGEALVGYDDEHIYLVADVKDTSLARTKDAGQYEDRLSLELFLPDSSGRGGASHRVDVFPGVPGKLPAVVKVDGQVIKNAAAVEAPHEGGLTIEAQLPWNALKRTKGARVGMQGRLLYYDASRPGSTTSIVATSAATGAKMPPLTLEAETGLFQSLIEPKGLPSLPARHAFGDLTGKGGVEHIALYGHFLSIVGPGYKGGKQFYFSELDVSSADRIRRLDVTDLSGDGKAEIILEKRLGPDDSYRDVLVVLTLVADEVPRQVFAAEIGMLTSDGELHNQVAIKGDGARSLIVLSQGKSKGLDPGTFREPNIGAGFIDALKPWEAVQSRSYAWKDKQFVQVDETRRKGSATPPAVASPPSRGQSISPPPPRAPSAGEMLDRVYALYRKDRGVRPQAPRFDLVTDVIEDQQNERVLIHDRDLLVFGKGFKKGLSYTYLTIGVKDAKDILSVATRDLVGDGKAEILVHAVLRAQASKQLGGDVVERQALFVYKVIGETLTRIFAAETGRSLKGRRVLGSLAFVPSETGLEIHLDRLRAIGYSEQNYPFPEESLPSGGLEPLLLPWGSVPARRYAFDGSAYTLQ